MTSKERVLTACRHEQPDRAPIQGYFTPEIWQRLQEHFGDRNLREVLGIDFAGTWPKSTAGPYGPGPGVPGEAQWYDEWGVGYCMKPNPSGGSYPETCELALAQIKTLNDVENYPWPSPEDLDYAGLVGQCEAESNYAVCFGDAGIPDILNGVSRGRGMELVMMDLALEDPVGMAIVDRRVEYYFEVCRRGLEAAAGKIDILCLGEDTGNQRGRMFSPACFERVFRPRLQRFYDLAHDFGVLAMMHSCGDTHEIIPTFIEMGLDILDAMQPEPAGMNPARLKAQFGDRISFCGLVSTQQTLPHGTAADVRAEVRERLRIMGQGGGYIVAPAHAIQPDTPLENVLALFAEAQGLEEL